MSLRRFSWVLVAFVALSQGSPRLLAQTQTSGDLAGVVTDPSSGVVPGADVSPQWTTQGATARKQPPMHRDNTAFFAPDARILHPYCNRSFGFQGASKTVQVALGTVTTGNLQLAIGTSTTTVSVTSTVPLLKEQKTGMLPRPSMNGQCRRFPISCNDITFSAELAPGVVANTSGGGLGNFSSFGLGANANLFTINGMDDNDPFLNTSNSGATSLLLGNDEVQEVSVVGNGYSAEYGGLAGAQISILTSGGGNTLHGRATYYWNARSLTPTIRFSMPPTLRVLS